MPVPRAPVAVAATLLLAGCLGAASEPAPEPAAVVEPAPVEPFTLEATDCVEGGFVAAYQANGLLPFGGGGRGGGDLPVLAGVWQTADIRKEIGNPMRDGLGQPVQGPLFGNWHMGFRCASVNSTGGPAEDYVFGYIGEMVEAPKWDTGGADVHFLMSGFGFAAGAPAEDVRAKTTAGITEAVESRIDWLAPKELPRSAAYVVYVDAQKGLYESWSTMGYLRDVPERTIRLWWQVPVDGSTMQGGHDHGEGEEEGAGHSGPYHPVYWDMTVSAARQYTTPPQDGVEWAAHNKLGMEHFPSVAGQPTLTNVYEYESVRITSGQVFEDVRIAELWTH